jgi:TolB-like protein
LSIKLEPVSAPELKSLDMSGFFEEVKRRKVYRVAVAYIIAAGGIIQLASAAFPAWELPNWALRLVIVLLLLGFPIALILAWAFDVTPAGITATPPLDPVAGPVRRRNIVVLAITGLLLSAAAGFFLLQNAAAHKIDKSIAVLPFENLSDDKENAYFADGIQDDVLTNLAKIGDLKVISRTSVMGYRGKPSSVREIGKALGVSAILEGTVRKDRNSNRVRVNEAGAREALLKARQTIEQQIALAPANPARHCQYGLVLAWLGDKDAALAEAQRAMDLLPEAKDAFSGPDIVEAAAQVYALVGEKDRAFALLDHLLSEPSSVTVFNLKLNPLWDSLRHDPRFQALLDKYGRKT